MTAPQIRHADPLYAPPRRPGARDTRETLERLAAAHALLDETCDTILGGDVPSGVNRLIVGLREAYDHLGDEAWRAFADDVCLSHRVADVIREDPFARRAYEKPRGYPGDAGILDIIYDAVPLPPETTALGAALHAHNVTSPASVSVRERRSILVDAIDRAAAVAPGRARVLSVACGHLREAQASAAVRDGALASFHALDQDVLSLALLHAEHAPLGVTPVHGSVKDLLAGRQRFDGMTLVYAAGLYDYLPTPVAARLTRVMFEMLAPGGRLLVANFCPELLDIGVMEGIMAWRLIYRDEAEMARIAAAVPGGAVARQRTFRDSGGNVVYLEIERG